MLPVDFACFLAQGKCLDTLVAYKRERETGIEARASFSLHHGGPEARPYGTDAFFHGVAIPKGSPFRPGAGWRLGIRPDRMEGSRPWEVFVPDLQTVDGRIHASKMERMKIPDRATLTALLGTTPVSAAVGDANISIHQHHVGTEKVGDSWVLWVPVSPITEFWKDCTALQAGVPFTPKGAIRLTTHDYLQLVATSGQRPNPEMVAL